MKVKIKLIFAWYDFWIGFFWNKELQKLYIFLVPMLGIRLDFDKGLINISKNDLRTRQNKIYQCKDCSDVITKHQYEVCDGCCMECVILEL